MGLKKIQVDLEKTLNPDNSDLSTNKIPLNTTANKLPHSQCIDSFPPQHNGHKSNASCYHYNGQSHGI